MCNKLPFARFRCHLYYVHFDRRMKWTIVNELGHGITRSKARPECAKRANVCKDFCRLHVLAFGLSYLGYLTLRDYSLELSMPIVHSHRRIPNLLGIKMPDRNRQGKGINPLDKRHSTTRDTSTDPNRLRYGNCHLACEHIQSSLHRLHQRYILQKLSLIHI